MLAASSSFAACSGCCFYKVSNKFTPNRIRTRNGVELLNSCLNNAGINSSHWITNHSSNRAPKSFGKSEGFDRWIMSPGELRSSHAALHGINHGFNFFNQSASFSIVKLSPSSTLAT